MRSCRSKYKAQPAYVDGIKFDSRAEARRYLKLLEMERNGSISALQRQVEFEVIPAQRDAEGKLLERAVRYRSDFTYVQDGHLVVEDVKGMLTPEYVIKRKLMLKEYGIRVKEVRNVNSESSD